MAAGSPTAPGAPSFGWDDDVRAALRCHVGMAATPAGGRPATYRYAAVGVLASALVVFLIAAPGGDWSRAVALAIQAVALIVAVATSRARAGVRRGRALAVALAAGAIVIGTAAGWIPAVVSFAAGGLLSVAIPAALVGGLLRLIDAEGVTLQAVAGAVTVYLLLGVLFAWMVSFAAHVDTRPYFAGGQTLADRPAVYFSFTVLTTTGFGDYTAASPLARTLAVAEMLTGQLYLVTVIGLLVGNFSRQRGPGPAQ
jgi:hypothetical protein